MPLLFANFGEQLCVFYNAKFYRDIFLKHFKDCRTYLRCQLVFQVRRYFFQRFER